MSDPTLPKKRGVSAWISGGLVVLLLAGAVVMGFEEMQASQLMPQHTGAPQASFERLEGGSLSLESLRGQVVVLTFWATWCPPCLEELPQLLALTGELGPMGVTLVAASEDDPHDAHQLLRDFVSQRLPALAPSVVLSNPVAAQRFKVQALPTLYVIDRAGRVHASRRGLVSAGQVRRWVEEALQAPPP